MRTLTVVLCSCFATSLVLLSGCGGSDAPLPGVAIDPSDRGQTIKLWVGQVAELWEDGGIGVGYDSDTDPDGRLEFAGDWSPTRGGHLTWTALRPGRIEVTVYRYPIVPDPPVHLIATFTVVVSR